MIIFYFSEALKSIFRSKFSSVVTVIAITIAVGLSITSIGMVLLSKKIEQQLISRIEVSVFVKDSLNNTQLKKIKNEIQKEKTIVSVDLIDREEAREKFIKETGKDFLSVLELNPLPVSFNVKFKADIKEEAVLLNTIDNIGNINNVTEVVYDYDLVIKILKYLESGKVIIYILQFAFIIISVFMVYTGGRLDFKLRAEEYETMKLVGAKLRVLKLPVLIKGILLGVFAGLLLNVLYYVIYYLLQRAYAQLSFDTIHYFVNITILILGVVFGLTGSLFSVRKINLKV